MKAISATLSLTTTLLIACSGSTPPAETPPPAAAPETTAAPPPAPESAGLPEAHKHEAHQAHEAHEHAGGGERLRPLVASHLLAKLEAAGLDPRALPKIEKLTKKNRIPVMEAMAEALGVECTGCHAGKDDFEAETEHKQIARHMWNDIVAVARLDQGPLFCDSCHQGSMHVLDRTNMDEVKAYMKAQFAGRLTTTAGAEVTCANCHGKPFEPEIFEKLWHVEEAD